MNTIMVVNTIWIFVVILLMVDHYHKLNQVMSKVGHDYNCRYKKWFVRFTQTTRSAFQEDIYKRIGRP